MFDFDTIKEVFASISKNKLRTFLTGLAIAWGIFLLIILLGVGNGFRNGMTSNFSGRAQNSISIYPGSTSVPYKGMPSNRMIKFDTKDYDLIRRKMPNVEYVSVSVNKSANLTYGEEYGTWNIDGVTPQAQFIQQVNINNKQGRFINDMDINSRRKVIVITSDIEDVLFKGESGLGKKIQVDNLVFTVVGVYKDNSGRFNPRAYIPFTTAQALYNSGYGFGSVEFTVKGLNTKEANEKYEELLRERLGRLHSFDPQDRSAVYINNTASWALETQNIFMVIDLFVLVVGLASLMAGIVGIGNIMLITVKERTKEIGIRKALGATPGSVLKLIIIEAVMITSIFGLIGMMTGIGLTEAVALMLAQSPTDKSDPNQATLFLNPTVQVWAVLGATFLLIIIGVFAGLLAARKAVKVSPIEAMRAD